MQKSLRRPAESHVQQNTTGSGKKFMVCGPHSVYYTLVPLMHRRSPSQFAALSI